MSKPTHVILYYWPEAWRVQSVDFTTNPKELEQALRDSGHTIVGIYDTRVPAQMFTLGNRASADNIQDIQDFLN